MLVFLSGPHEEVISWTYWFFCPGAITFAAFILILFILLQFFFNVFFNLGAIENFPTWLIFIHNWIKSFLKMGFKNWSLPLYPLVFSTSFFIYWTNFSSWLPYILTLTIFLPIIFFFTWSNLITANVLGIYKHGFNILNLFFPTGAPALISFILVPVEIIAYVSRFISLTVRMLANMLAGYILLEMLFMFFFVLITLATHFVLVNIILATLISSITVLKILISFLQAFIFSLLLGFYLNDGINNH